MTEANTAKDFLDEKTWGIRADNAILTDEQLSQVHPNIVQDPNHSTWLNPRVDKNSEYDDITNTIHVRPGYNIEEDMTANIIHEKCHAYLTQIAGLNQKYINRPYPENTLEQVAYTTQFYHLIKRGYSLDEVKKLGEFPGFFKDHNDILTQYFKYAQEKYNQERTKQQTHIPIQNESGGR